MKAVKKFFKRGKRKPQSDASSGQPKSPAAPAPQPPTDRQKQNQGGGRGSEAEAKRRSAEETKVVIPKLPERDTGSSNRTTPKQEDGIRDPKARSNGDGDGNGNAPETAMALSKRNELGNSAEKIKYKGVSESFRGLTVTQRFDVTDIAESDPNEFVTLGDAYDAIPLLEQTKLPRGGISMETKAVGRVQVSYGLFHR
jgi:hypothetical protein